jgi:KUP system potassium uptake protein
MATKNAKNIPLLILASLGVVFGDIGTSPLYALKLSVEATTESGLGMVSGVYGVLSLITWALMIVVSIKYVLVIMRTDNKGEGGVLALLALILRKMGNRNHKHIRWVMIFVGILGASLFFGDSLITPAISVLSAVEGLKLLSPKLGHYVIIISLGLVALLFASEKFGTSKVGGVFGPIMLVWFFIIGLLGLIQVIAHPQILRALNPMYGINYLYNHIVFSGVILGAVVLAITGGEALYADMGHFGRTPIKISWFGIVLPSLLLNYFGQGALLITNPNFIDNPFYRLAPDWGLIPLIILSSTATIIASQAVISGVFSMATQAIQLGYLPRMKIKYTSSKEQGQVYLSKINIFLFLGVALLILGFKNSDSLANAYGVAVTGTMLTTTILASYLLIFLRKWNKIILIPVFIFIFIVDIAFFSSNITKFIDGGWLPVVIASGTLLVILSWIIGREKMLKARWNGAIKIKKFVSEIKRKKIKRIPGTAIFFVPNLEVIPMTLINNLKHNKVLHKRIVCMHIKVENYPTVDDLERLTTHRLPENFYMITVRYGFQEEPNIPRVLALLRAREFHFSMMETSFFVGKVKVIAKKPSIFTSLFIYMHRLMLGATEYYKIPKERVIELGGVIEI